MHWILRPTCRSGNVVSKVLEPTDAVHMCKLAPNALAGVPAHHQAPMIFRSSMQNTAVQVALHHVLSELNAIFPPLRQSEKPPYLATCEFPVTAFVVAVVYCSLLRWRISLGA